MQPTKMRRQILGVASLLSGKTVVSAMDFRKVIDMAGENSLVYLDPPYQGTSFTRDHRYYDGLTYDEFVDALLVMNDKNISYIISYDGQTGDKYHGKLLPEKLFLAHLYIHAGRSSQATLLGENRDTVESLYLSLALMDRLNKEDSNKGVAIEQIMEQKEFALT